MASNSDRASRWRNLRPWQILQSHLAEGNSREIPTGIWSVFDEAMGRPAFRGPRYPGPGSSHSRFVTDDDEDSSRQGRILETRLRDWFGTTVFESLERISERNGRPIDAKAVLSQCSKEIYKPKAGGGAKGKTAAAEQEDCPVCLEKFVAGQSLLCLPCNHKFHVDCLTPWIKSDHGRCPCCRADILSSAAGGGGGGGGGGSRSMGSTTVFIAGSNGNSSREGGGGGRGSRAEREATDIMSVIAAMEAAMERMGFRS